MKHATYIPLRTAPEDDGLCRDHRSWDGVSDKPSGTCYKKWNHVGRHKYREINPREPLE